jgi:hypothetical protein
MLVASKCFPLLHQQRTFGSAGGASVQCHIGCGPPSRQQVRAVRAAAEHLRNPGVVCARNQTGRLWGPKGFRYGGMVSDQHLRKYLWLKRSPEPQGFAPCCKNTTPQKSLRLPSIGGDPATILLPLLPTFRVPFEVGGKKHVFSEPSQFFSLQHWRNPDLYPARRLRFSRW